MLKAASSDCPSMPPGSAEHTTRKGDPPILVRQSSGSKNRLMFMRNIVLLVVLFSPAVRAIAQETPNTQSQKPENPAEPEAHGTRLQWKDLPKNLWQDQKAIVSSPLHIDRDNAKWWVLLGTGTAALFATDRQGLRPSSRDGFRNYRQSMGFENRRGLHDLSIDCGVLLLWQGR